jgi:hypothetical protein
MACEVSPKTEHRQILGRLLGYAQRNVSRSEPPRGFHSLIVPLETIRQGGGPEPAQIRELFTTESELAEGGFTMRYDPEGDRILFNRISQHPASPAGQVAAQPALLAVVEPTMSVEQVTVIAKQEWKNDPKLAREFTSEAAYVAWRKAEFSGRARVLGRPRVHD